MSENNFFLQNRTAGVSRLFLSLNRLHKMIKYIKGSRLRFILFGIFLSIGVFFLCMCLGLLEKTLEIWAW